MSHRNSSPPATNRRRLLHRPLLARLSALGLLVLGTSLRLEATTVLPVDLDSLADQAELVFTGTAVHREVALSKDGAFPFTFITFRIHDVLKGRTRTQDIALRFEGGDLGDHGVGVEGMPQFDEGETYLLFVRGNGSFSCPILGWWQGQFPFSREARSGKRILVDSNGAPLQGIHNDRWVRGPARQLAVAQKGTRAIVLSEENVKIAPAGGAPRLEPASAAGKALAFETPKADEIVDRLRSFLRGRRQAKSFAPGRLVESARPEDVPDHAGWFAARPR